MELLASAAVHPDRAVLVVTHDSRVFHFADVIAHMDDGRIVRTEAGPKTLPAIHPPTPSLSSLSSQPSA